MSHIVHRRAQTAPLLRSVLLLAAAALFTLTSPPGWSQPRPARLALLIANAKYPDAEAPLPTTISDARSLADELRQHGFEVDLKENLDKSQMEAAVDALAGKIRSGTDVLFYFGGFGIQSERKTYLVPVNARIWTEPDVRKDGISLDEVLASMHKKGAKAKIVILDAARRNPFERRFRAVAAGLPTMDIPENTVAISSAAASRVVTDRPGNNSLFMSELIKELRTPNLPAEGVFNRVRLAVSRMSKNEEVPWVASSMTEPIILTTHGQQSPPPPPPTPTDALVLPVQWGTGERVELATAKKKLHDAAMAWLGPQRFGNNSAPESVGKAFSEWYPKAGLPKAVAICIDWRQTTARQLVLAKRGWVTYSKGAKCPDAKSCGTRTTDECTSNLHCPNACSAVDVDGANAIEPPTTWAANLGGSAPHTPGTTPDMPCTQLSQARSPQSQQPVELTFSNNSPDPLRIFWVDHEGNQKLYRRLDAGQRYTQNTFQDHLWLVNGNFGCVGIFKARPKRTVELE